MPGIAGWRPRAERKPRVHGHLHGDPNRRGRGFRHQHRLRQNRQHDIAHNQRDRAGITSTRADDCQNLDQQQLCSPRRDAVLQLQGHQFRQRHADVGGGGGGQQDRLGLVPIDREWLGTWRVDHVYSHHHDHAGRCGRGRYHQHGLGQIRQHDVANDEPHRASQSVIRARIGQDGQPDNLQRTGRGHCLQLHRQEPG